MTSQQKPATPEGLSTEMGGLHSQQPSEEGEEAPSSDDGVGEETLDDSHQIIRVYCPTVGKNKDSAANKNSLSSVHPSFAPCKRLIRSRLDDYDRGTVGERTAIVEEVSRRVEFFQGVHPTTPLRARASQKLILKAFRFLILKKQTASSTTDWKTLTSPPDVLEPAIRPPVHRRLLPAATDDTKTDPVGTIPQTTSKKGVDVAVDKMNDSSKMRVYFEAHRFNDPSYPPYQTALQSRREEYLVGDAGQRSQIVQELVDRLEFYRLPNTTTPLDETATRTKILKGLQSLLIKDTGSRKQKQLQQQQSSCKDTDKTCPAPAKDHPGVHSGQRRSPSSSSCWPLPNMKLAEMAKAPLSPIDSATCSSAKISANDSGTDTCNKLRVFYELYKFNHPTDVPYKKLLHSRLGEYQSSGATERERIVDELVGRIEFTLLPGKTQLDDKAARTKIQQALYHISRHSLSKDKAPVGAPDAAFGEETLELSLLTTSIAKKKVPGQPAIPQTSCPLKDIVALLSKTSSREETEKKRVYTSKAGKRRGPKCVPYQDFIKSRWKDYQSGDAAQRAKLFDEMLCRFEFYRFPEDTHMDDKAAKKKAVQAFGGIRQASTGDIPALDQGHETVTDLLIMPQSNPKCSSNKAGVVHEKEDSETVDVSLEKVHPLSKNKSPVCALDHNPAFLHETLVNTSLSSIPVLEEDNKDQPTLPQTVCHYKEIVPFQKTSSNVESEKTRAYTSSRNTGKGQGLNCASMKSLSVNNCSLLIPEVAGTISDKTYDCESISIGKHTLPTLAKSGERSLSTAKSYNASKTYSAEQSIRCERPGTTVNVSLPTSNHRIHDQEADGAWSGDVSSLIDAGPVYLIEKDILDCSLEGNKSDLVADKILVYFTVGRYHHPSFEPYKELIESKWKDYESGCSAARKKIVDDLVGRVEFYILPKKTQLDEDSSRNKIKRELMRRIDSEKYSSPNSSIQGGCAQRECFQRDCEASDCCDKRPHELDVAGARNLETGDFENGREMTDTAAETTDSRDNAKLPASLVEDLETVSVPIQLQDFPSNDNDFPSTVAQRNESRRNARVVSLGACHGSSPFAAEAERPTRETARVARADKSKARSSLKRRKKKRKLAANDNSLAFGSGPSYRAVKDWLQSLMQDVANREKTLFEHTMKIEEKRYQEAANVEYLKKMESMLAGEEATIQEKKEQIVSLETKLKRMIAVDRTDSDLSEDSDIDDSE